MTPHEREQLLELAEQIVLNLRNRFAGIDNMHFPARGPVQPCPGIRCSVKMTPRL